MEAASDETEKQYWNSQVSWLEENFPNGVYRDVTGLCKVSTLDEEDGIKDQEYSLNAGRYVGVVMEGDGKSQEEFMQDMTQMQT